MAFTDMMTSSRGPGLIGLLLALLILFGFGTLLLLSTDERFLGGNQSIESVIAHQQRDIETMEQALGGMKKTLEVLPARREGEKELELARRERLFAADKAAGVRASITATTGAIAARTAELEAYKDKYRSFARTQAKGLTLARLETRDGTVYENVTVKDVNAVGMQISHDGGGRRIAFEQLPEELQDRFQFDPKQKAVALAREKAMQDAHETSVDTTLAAVKERADRQREAAAAKLSEDTIAAIRMKEERIRTMVREIDDLERAIVVESTKRLSNAPQMRAKLTEKKQDLSALRADVVRLGTTL